jgi:AraC-like DNA-binding protein
LSTGHLSLRAATGIIRTVERLGIEPAPLWALLESSPQALGDPDAIVPIDRVYSLWETLDARLGRDDLAIEVASTGRRPVGDVFGFVLMTSPTAGAALGNAIRFMQLVSASARWTLESTPSSVLLVQTRNVERRGAALAIEASFGEAVARLRELLLQPNLQCDVTFRHSAPGDARAHRAFFRGRVTFDAPRNTLRLPASLLAQPMPKGDPALLDWFEQQAAVALAKITAQTADALVERARRLLARDLRRAPTIAHVAKELAMGSRTLRRRLEAEGVQFQSLLDEVRSSVARQHLAEPRLAIAEVAYLLGFSEPSAFHRAFKRWTGQTPSDYRRTVVREGSKRPES